MRFEVRGKTVNASTGGATPDGERPLVVFIHGAGADRSVWALVTRRIAGAGHDVLAVDLPGHGHSEGPVPTSIGDHAAWLGDLIAGRPQGSAHLVGHSMGALIALETAAGFPDLVTSLSMVGVSAEMWVHPQLLAAADDGRHLAIELMTDWSFGSADKLGRHAAPGWVATTAAMRQLEQRAPDTLGLDLRACAAYGAGVQAAAAVRCPTLFVIGERDRMTPPGTTTPLIGVAQDATVVRLPGEAHAMPVTAPHEVSEALVTFLGTV